MIICIVGAGAAGMMAAVSARAQNPIATIVVVEKNAVLGRKVIISGGGRCNVTTGITDVRTVLTKYPRGSRFLTSAMYAFPPDQVMEWFEQHGVALKVEADNRVFPQSNNGKDVVGVFERLFRELAIAVVTQQTVIQVQRHGKQFAVKLQSGRIIVADKLILTTGGQAYRHTGSSGEGYQFAESLGHTITPLASSLNSFILTEAWPKTHSGLSFERVGLMVKERPQCMAEGPIVFTHQGISGPAVFVISGLVAFTTYTKSAPLLVLIDFVPNQTQEQLLTTISRQIEQHPKQLLKTLVHTWLPVAMVDTLMNELRIPLIQTNAATSKHARRAVVAWLKACAVSAIGRGTGAEFVTAGGVDTKEVDARTMESRLCPGLFFAGEILDIDGYTGGFNLQASWATGRAAGSSV
ncbi:MAG: hypothetical protein ACD_41C00330G0005 [uncultured bacterium]|nr:MAG: hypothetical protein ACD_41C00330G0005 [uncultured bacterium]